ncbi:hypothetical protein ACQ4PT_051109 [Festuca glaucescens]
MGLAAFASGRFTALVVNGFMLTAASDKEGAASDLFEEEVDRRAEEFISAFQHRIRILCPPPPSRTQQYDRWTGCLLQVNDLSQYHNWILQETIRCMCGEHPGSTILLYLLLEMSIMMRLSIKSENCLLDSLLIQLPQINLLRQTRMFLLAQRGSSWTDPRSIPLMVAQSILGSWNRSIGVGNCSGSSLARGISNGGLAESLMAFNTNYCDT